MAAASPRPSGDETSTNVLVSGVQGVLVAAAHLRLITSNTFKFKYLTCKYFMCRNPYLDSSSIQEQGT